MPSEPTAVRSKAPGVSLLGGSNMDEGTEFMSEAPSITCSATKQDFEVGPRVCGALCWHFGCPATHQDCAGHSAALRTFCGGLGTGAVSFSEEQMWLTRAFWHTLRNGGSGSRSGSVQSWGEPLSRAASWPVQQPNEVSCFNVVL